MTPRQFAIAAEGADKRRFDALKAGRRESNPPWSAASAAKFVDDYSAVFDELLDRVDATPGSAA
jgi:hypothetical protein